MYAAVIHEYNQREIAGIKKDIREGLDIRALLGSDSQDVFRYRARMKAALLDVLKKVRDFGAGHVKDELARQ